MVEEFSIKIWGNFHLTNTIESQCPHIMEMAKEIQEIDGFVECFANFRDSKVYDAAQKYCKHLACPVPLGIIKGVEVACGLALPKAIIIDFL